MLEYVHGYRSKDCKNNLRYLKNGHIGYNAAASAIDVDNEITLGDSNIASIRCQVQTISSLSDILGLWSDE